MYKKFNINWLLILIVSGLLMGCSSKKDEQNGRLDLETNINESQASEALGETQKEDGTVAVYVCGCVIRPGVYYLPQDSRVCDAIESAGGLTKEASVNYWNLAHKIEDGMKIYVPTEEESLSMEPQEEVNTSTSNGKININTADKEELMKLPGIGSTRADRIIAYRTEHGKFADITDLMNVSGIKGTIYQELEDYITV